MDAQQDDLLERGFLLGLRLAQHAFKVTVLAKDDPTWELLHRIADGDITLVDSPSEKLLKYPNMTEQMMEYLRRNTNAVIERDRETAMAVLRHMSRREEAK